jgi:hypothetical protein
VSSWHQSKPLGLRRRSPGPALEKGSRLLNVDQAAGRLNVSVRNIRHQIHQRRLSLIARMLERALEEAEPEIPVASASVVPLRFARSRDHFHSDTNRRTR